MLLMEPTCKGNASNVSVFRARCRSARRSVEHFTINPTDCSPGDVFHVTLIGIVCGRLCSLVRRPPRLHAHMCTAESCFLPNSDKFQPRKAFYVRGIARAILGRTTEVLKKDSSLGQSFHFIRFANSSTRENGFSLVVRIFVDSRVVCNSKSQLCDISLYIVT